MSAALIITMALVAVVGGVIGWRSSTSYIYRRSVNDPPRPNGLTRREHDRTIRRRRKIRRLFITFGYAVGGAVVGAIAALVVTRA